jgi:hypothetical protein
MIKLLLLATGLVSSLAMARPTEEGRLSTATKLRIKEALEQCTFYKRVDNTSLLKVLTVDFKRPGCAQRIDLSGGVGNITWGSQIARISLNPNPAYYQDLEEMIVRLSYYNDMGSPSVTLKVSYNDDAVSEDETFSIDPWIGMLEALKHASGATIVR